MLAIWERILLASTEFGRRLRRRTRNGEKGLDNSQHIQREENETHLWVDGRFPAGAARASCDQCASGPGRRCRWTPKSKWPAETAPPPRLSPRVRSWSSLQHNTTQTQLKLGRSWPCSCLLSVYKLVENSFARERRFALYRMAIRNLSLGRRKRILLPTLNESLSMIALTLENWQS